MLEEESQGLQRQGFGPQSTCVHIGNGYFWKVSSSFYFKDWISTVSYISIFKYKGRSASLPQINSNYLRIVRYIDLSTSLTLSTHTISKKYMCVMLASDREFSEEKQISVCVHVHAGWSHGGNLWRAMVACAFALIDLQSPKSPKREQFSWQTLCLLSSEL